MIITIFTPSYNRAKTLPRLYHSLLQQTNQDFCWQIVDDGSIDETEILVQTWINEKKIPIRYFKQKNCGKPMAHNKGVELTETELFVCVDSDDYLAENAIEEVIQCWKSAKKNDVGILAFKATIDKPLTRIQNGGNGKRTTLKNAYDHLGLVGDTMLVFRTEIIKKYKFPYFNGEKFVPEGYLYDQIDQEGQLILLEKPLYICEYLEDGYTNNMAKLLKNNPKGYFTFLRQRLSIDKTPREKFLDSIRYVAMAKAHNMPIIKNAVYPMYAFLAYPAGLLLYHKKYRGI